LRSSIFNDRSYADAPVAQLDRASDFGSEGWGFESLQARQSLIIYSFSHTIDEGSCAQAN
jgi:hypothetical protein